MREIKFRVVVAGKIITMRDHNLVYDLDTGKWRLDMYSQGGEFCESCEDFELLQFTGLKDKNGKEIYAGDVLDLQLHTPALVTWNEKYASFSLERKGWLYSHWFGESTEPEEVTVLGNVYDNPELLEAK